MGDNERKIVYAFLNHELRMKQEENRRMKEEVEKMKEGSG